MANRPDKPVWELVGMDQMTYSKLPYHEKQILMRRAGYPIKINECAIKVPKFTDWAITAYLQEKAIRLHEMGEKGEKASWNY